MSTAQPMSDARREASYGRTWLTMTPRQSRRWIKKIRRADPPFPVASAIGSKGRPTPRQRRRGTAR